MKSGEKEPDLALEWLEKRFPYPAGPKSMTWGEVIECLAAYKAEPVAGESRALALKGLADTLVGCAQLLDTIKGEWGASWSEWDQSIRDGITSQLEIIYAPEACRCGQGFTVTCPVHGKPEPDYKALCELAAKVLLQHMNDEDYEMSLAGLYARLTENL